MIDYNILADSVDFYSNRGYKYIELPWIIEKDYIEFTYKESNKFILQDNRSLLGSAEQSFIKLYKENRLRGSFQSITPCFRNDNIDEIHQESFMKNEIFVNDYISSDRLLELINECLEFYKKHTNIESIIEAVKTKDEFSLESYDININGIEVGSYGIRTVEDISWIYGTGLALPRFTHTQQRNKIG